MSKIYEKSEIKLWHGDNTHLLRNKNSDPNSIHKFTNKNWVLDSILLLLLKVRFAPSFWICVSSWDLKICNMVHTCCMNAAIYLFIWKKIRKLNWWSSALVHLKVMVHPVLSPKLSFPRVQTLSHTAQISMKKNNPHCRLHLIFIFIFTTIVQLFSNFAGQWFPAILPQSVPCICCIEWLKMVANPCNAGHPFTASDG